jgi:hypothetical protein
VIQFIVRVVLCSVSVNSPSSCVVLCDMSFAVVMCICLCILFVVTYCITTAICSPVVIIIIIIIIIIKSRRESQAYIDCHETASKVVFFNPEEGGFVTPNHRLTSSPGHKTAFGPRQHSLFWFLSPSGGITIFFLCFQTYARFEMRGRGGGVVLLRSTRVR